MKVSMIGALPVEYVFFIIFIENFLQFLSNAINSPRTFT